MANGVKVHRAEQWDGAAEHYDDEVRLLGSVLPRPAREECRTLRKGFRRAVRRSTDMALLH